MPPYGNQVEFYTRLVIDRPSGKITQNLEPTDDPKTHCRAIWRIAVAMREVPDCDWYILPGRVRMDVLEDEVA